MAQVPLDVTDDGVTLLAVEKVAGLLIKSGKLHRTESDAPAEVSDAPAEVSAARAEEVSVAIVAID